VSEHTPGPWVARETGGVAWSGQRGWAIDYNADQEQVVDFVYQEADARLIAAAPDLLETLELILETRTQEKHAWNWAPGDSPLHDRCRVAIAKAKGLAPLDAHLQGCFKSDDPTS